MKALKIKTEYADITPSSQTKVTTCGNIVEHLTMSRVNRKGSGIINLGNYQYMIPGEVDPYTGEVVVHDMERTENRAENTKGLAQSMKKVRDLLNCNVTNPKHCRWVTLTYAENMTDTKRLYSDRQKFWQRLTNWHKKNGHPVPEYISIVEPQGRGAWHMHEVWIYPSKAPYLPNETIREIWRQGFVTVKKLEDVDNVGAYLTAYLCDVPLDEAEAAGLNTNGLEVKEVEVTAEDGSKTHKRYVKGARLHLYPTGMNFYRTSRGVKRPEVEWMSQREAKEKVSAATLTYSKAMRLTDGEQFRSDLVYEYYNTVRGKSQ